MTLQAGTKLEDRYEVVRTITSGGMGSIYEARDLHLNGRRVAVKQMLEHLLEGEQAAMFREKFQAEVVFLRSLQHPGIPQAYDSFTQDGIHYMVMEFIVGRNLEQELEERLQLTGQPFSVEQIVRDTRQVLEILVYLHSQIPPLLHRDIKPANLIREHPSGRIRLVDFGMARLLSDLGKTQTQLGTLGYSPLEQLQGRAEQRSDIYALGASLHHLVTGVAPTALNIPPVHKLKPDLDPATAAVIDRACASEINIRFGSAQEMLRALDELRPHLPMVLDAPLKFQPLPRHDDPVAVEAVAPQEVELPFAPEELPPLALPSVAVKEPGSEFVQMGKAPLRSKAFQWTLPRQLAVIGLLSMLAFVFGLGMTQDRGPVVTATPKSGASPEVTVSRTPLAVALATPKLTPTPTPRATPKPTPKPEPKPVPKPSPQETPESFSLTHGPSYPTAPQSGTGHETLSLRDSSSRLEVNLDKAWNPIERIQSQSYFSRGFRKEEGHQEFTLDVKGYAMEFSGEKYRNSFRAEHAGWNAATLSGADEAFTSGQGRSQKCEALVIKQGHYYWVSLRGKGSGLTSQSFQDELTKAWSSLNIVD